MNYFKNFKPLSRQELATLNGGAVPNPTDAECADLVMPEPGRYCKSEE